MAGITLRDYVREIEKQLDGKRTDEAIAHCHYLLQTYAKHLDVYRLLGKAFLENQRYGDAADIFQRVLSAIPDDFVSHAGMSIIREDEGNLDEAIWHMERAFDVQPSNSAIQEELRRMYGRRDNVEPPKIRLTRGALARMYFRGELYAQAVAETRAALAESPDRLDLQALLAEIHDKAGQKAEAVDMANQILRRLPFCLVANRILYETLSATSDREDEAQTYRQRLSQLDPYYAFVTPQSPNLESVPDAAIRLDKLDWKVGQTQAGRGSQPGWAASLGVDLGDSDQTPAALPDWLSTFSEAKTGEAEGGSVPAFANNNVETPLPEGEDGAASPVGEDQIPDWMKDLGWTPASPESREAEAGYRLEDDQELEAESAESDLASSELPDWLQSIAPQTEASDAAPADENVDPWMDRLLSGAETPPAAGASDAEQPDWLDAALAGGAAATFDAAQPSEAGQPEAEAAPDSEALPEWLIGEAALTGAPSAGADDTPTAPPDWLAELGGVSEDSEALPPTGADELPDWLRAERSSSATPGDLPDWLTREPAPAADSGEPPAWLYEETGESALAETAAESSDLPDWLSAGAPTAEPAAETPAAEELPDWLMGGAAGTEPATEEPAAEGELPDWLMGGAVETEPAAVTEEPAAEGELPAWLTAETTAESEETSPAGAGELPDWLMGSAAETEPAAVAEEPAAEGELPAWLTAETPVEDAEEAEAPPVAEGELPEWLTQEPRAAESEAAEESAAGGELPAWLFGSAAEAAAGHPTEDRATPEDEIPAWLLDAEPPAPPSEAPEDAVEPTEPEPAEAETLPAWLMEAQEASAIIIDEATVPETPAIAAPVEPEPAELDDAFAWLAAMLTPQEEAAEPPAAGVASTTPTAPVEEIPAPPSAASAPTEPGAGVFPMDDADATFAWLESLAVKQGASEALLLSPEERQETAPEWVQQAAAEAEAQAALPPETPAPEMEAVEPDEPTDDELGLGAAIFAAEAPPAEPVTSSEPPAAFDEDDAFAWLESLAVKQGANEALLLSPEERQDTAPEWVQQAAAEAEAHTLTDHDIETPAAEETEPAEMAAAAESPVEPVEPLEPTPAEPTVPSLDDDATFAWLESLAVKQGANEALLLTPEERQETAPEWVQQAAAEAEAEPPTVTPEDSQPAVAAAEPPVMEIPPAEVQTPAAPVAAEAPAPVEPEPAPADTEAAAEPASAAAVTDEPGSEQEIPELPDWLAGGEFESRDEPLEWKLPVVTRRRYDLNLATLSELERLPGIGFIMAQRIVDYREVHGPFQQVDELLNIEDFTPFTLEAVRENLFIFPVAQPPAPAAGLRLPGMEMPPEEAAAEPEPGEPAPEAVARARELAAGGDWGLALEAYTRLIQSGEHLPLVIDDLNAATQQRPSDSELWQSLGDAYVRLNRLKDAMQAYAQAEKLLR